MNTKLSIIRFWGLVLVMLLALLMMSSCEEGFDINNSQPEPPPEEEEEGDDPNPSGQKPVINSMSVSPIRIPVTGATSIVCTASDPDNDPLTYKWTADSGSFPQGDEASSTVWQAPVTAGVYIIKITVSDNHNNSVFTEVDVTVEGIITTSDPAQ